jgi:hypothetical protein
VTGYAEQLRQAVDATVVHSPTTFSWFGELSPAIPRRLQGRLTERTARAHLVYTLRSKLYEDFYMRGGACPSRWTSPISTADRAPMRAALSAANTGTGCWESGWSVSQAENGRIAVARGGLELWVGAGDCRGASRAAGAAVEVRLPAEAFGLSPGFYLASGTRELAHDDPRRVVRLFWNLTPEAAAPFVAAATGGLNGAGIAFKLKVLDHPSAFDRCDAGVVYLHDGDLDAALTILMDVHERLAERLKPAVPALTKPLARGLGFACDPGRDESFGEHRCRLVAEGIVRAYETGDESPLDAARARLTEGGVDPERPWANP